MTNNYKYKGLPFTQEIAKEFLNRLSGKRFHMEKVGASVLQAHLDRDGSPPEEELSGIVCSALYSLYTNGRAKRTSRGNKNIWEVFPEGRQIFGSGRGAVYCFYNPRDREEAEARSGCQWACNIGETGGDVEERVRQQTSQWTVEPRIDLILRTSRQKDLESKIHSLLKVLDRHLKDFTASGREWFHTSPDEVVYLYRIVLPHFGFRYYD